MKKEAIIKISIVVSVLTILGMVLIRNFDSVVEGIHGGGQNSYRVQVDNNPDFSSPEVDSCASSPPNVPPLGPPNGTCAGGFIITAYAIPFGSLAFNVVYYARVMAWDEHSTASSWQNMTLCAGPGCQTSPVCTGGQTNCWKTPAHVAPDPDFTFSPANPSVGSPVTFSEKPPTFSAAATFASWSWNFGTGSPVTGTDSTLPLNISNGSFTYGALGSYTVTLTAEDEMGISCASSSVVILQRPLPKWREVAPR